MECTHVTAKLNINICNTQDTSWIHCKSDNKASSDPWKHHIWDQVPGKRQRLLFRVLLAVKTLYFDPSSPVNLTHINMKKTKQSNYCYEKLHVLNTNSYIPLRCLSPVLWLTMNNMFLSMLACYKQPNNWYETTIETPVIPMHLSVSDPCFRIDYAQNMLSSMESVGEHKHHMQMVMWYCYLNMKVDVGKTEINQICRAVELLLCD